MTQMRIRMRKLALKTREKVMTMPRKEQKREKRRAEKAEVAARLPESIEKELLERLKKGVYGDIYNYPVKQYNKVLDLEELEPASEDEEEPEIEYVEGYEELEEEEDMEDLGYFALEETGADDDVGMDDDDSDDDKSCKRGRKDSVSSQKRLKKDEPGAKQKKKAKVLVEVEHEDTTERHRMVL